MTEMQQQPALLKYYTLFSFFVIGVVSLLLGQILPIVSQRLSLTDAEAGTLFLAQFGGSMFGTLIAVRIAGRVGFVVTVLIGLLLIAVGLPALNLNSFAACWSAIFVYGCGLGIIIPSINLLTIETTPEANRSSSVNLINFCWGLGAICSQPFVATVSRGSSLLPVSLILVGAVLLLAICFLTVARAFRRFSSSGSAIVSDLRIWRRPSSWLFVLFTFFVVSIEGGLGGWLTTYTEDLKLSGIETMNLTVVYFVFFVVGRGLASVISRRISENVLISICAVLLVIGIFVIVSSTTFVVAGAVIAGLGSSAIFPTNMVRFARVFGPGATRQATPIFISGTLGAASISALVGFVSSSFGSLRTGILVVMVSAVLVLVFQIIIATVFRYEPARIGIS